MFTSYKCGILPVVIFLCEPQCGLFVVVIFLCEPQCGLFVVVIFLCEPQCGLFVVVIFLCELPYQSKGEMYIFERLLKRFVPSSIYSLWLPVFDIFKLIFVLETHFSVTLCTLFVAVVQRVR